MTRGFAGFGLTRCWAFLCRTTGVQEEARTGDAFAVPPAAQRPAAHAHQAEPSNSLLAPRRLPAPYPRTQLIRLTHNPGSDSGIRARLRG